MSTDLTSEGGHGAVPTGGSVPVEPKASASRRDWPLYEVFVRGKRGLNAGPLGLADTIAEDEAATGTAFALMEIG